MGLKRPSFICLIHFYKRAAAAARMSKAHPPELKKFMDKRIHLRINGGREVEGTLCGFDPFMNLVLDDSIEFTKQKTQNKIGMVVVRGSSVVMLEARDRI